MAFPPLAAASLAYREPWGLGVDPKNQSELSSNSTGNGCPSVTLENRPTSVIRGASYAIAFTPFSIVDPPGEDFAGGLPKR